MARPSCNRLSSVQSIHVYEWIKANWEKQVVGNKWTAEATAKRVTGDLGFLCTEGNLRTVLDEFFPKYNFMHAAPNPINPIHRLKQKADQYDELGQEVGRQLETIKKNLDSRIGEYERRLQGIHSRINNVVENLSNDIKTLQVAIRNIEEGVCRAVNQQV